MKKIQSAKNNKIKIFMIISSFVIIVSLLTISIVSLFSDVPIKRPGFSTSTEEQLYTDEYYYGDGTDANKGILGKTFTNGFFQSQEKTIEVDGKTFTGWFITGFEIDTIKNDLGINESLGFAAIQSKTESFATSLSFPEWTNAQKTDRYIGIDINYESIKGNDSDTDLLILATFMSAIKAVVIPESYQYISSAAFHYFTGLEYFETPFIGKYQGASGRGIKLTALENNYIPSSDSLGSMFSKAYVKTQQTTAKQDAFEDWIQYPYDGSSDPYVKTIMWQELQSGNTEFYYNVPKNLSRVVVTNDTIIGNNCFTGSPVKYVKIVDGPAQQEKGLIVGKYAFSECELMRECHLPYEKVTLSEGFLNHCLTLREFHLPYGITEIPKSSFYQCLELRELGMPTTIKYIREAAFYDCELLNGLKLYASAFEGGDVDSDGDGVADIDEDKYLSTGFDFMLPPGLKTIETYAFRNCRQLKQMVVGDTVDYIGYGAFMQCAALEEIELPFIGAHRGTEHTDACNSTETERKKTDLHNLFGYIFGSWNDSGIGYGANQVYLNSTTGLNVTETFAIPENLKSIVITDESVLSAGSLQNLKSVELININKEATSIAVGCLNGCANLKSLSIARTASGNIGSLFAGAAFSGSHVTTGNYHMPGTLTYIEITNQPTLNGGLFHNCQKIETVIFSEATTYANSGVFYNNPALKELEVPFVGRERGHVNVWMDRWGPSDYNYWNSHYNNAYRNSILWLFSTTSHADAYRVSLDCYYGGDHSRYIPNNFNILRVTDDTLIGPYSFDYLTSLKILEITNAPSYIAGGAAYGLKNLEQITIPYVGYNLNSTGATGESHVLGYIFGGYNTTDFYEASQAGTVFRIPKKLHTVNIGTPETYASEAYSKKIFAYAFQNCSSLTNINFGTANITELGYAAFDGCTNLLELQYPNATYNKVADYAFRNCKKVFNITTFIPDTVTEIGNYSFYGTSVGYLDNSTFLVNDLDLSPYEKIGNYAFANCLQLTKVKLPAKTNEDAGSLPIVYGDGVFSGCQYITSVELLTKNVTKYMFASCTSLVGIDLRGILVIPEGLLSGCTSLVNAYVNADGSEGGLFVDDKLTTINAYAFANCTSLEEFKLSSSTTFIASWAFTGCKGLDYMTIPKEMVTIDPNGWVNCDDDFFFYVYEPQEYWPTGWVNNWNCGYPVYVLGTADDSVFTYFYDETIRKYYITGIVAGKELVGVVQIPTFHNGVEVVGIDETLRTPDDKINGTQNISTQTKVKQVILPKSIIRVVGTPFGHGGRVDVYTELTKAEVTELYNSSNHENGWEVATNSSSNGFYNSHQQWMSGGLIFYGDYWQYGTGQLSNVPHLLTSKLEFVLDNSFTTYTGSAIEKQVIQIRLPAEIVTNLGLNVTSNTVCISDPYLNILNYTYSNNVSAGTATINMTINNSKLIEYNNVLKANPMTSSYLLYLVGNGRTHYTIEKAIVSLEAISNVGYTKDYDGTPWTFSDWGEQTVYGLDEFPGAQFTGTLRTSSADVGIYDQFTGNLYFQGGWKVIRNGVNISNNFEVFVMFDVEIIQMDVEIMWVKNPKPVNGVWQFIELDSDTSNPAVVAAQNKMDLSTRTNETGVYWYPYVGGDIQPYAVAVKKGTNTVVSKCIVSAYNYNPNSVGTLPYSSTGNIYQMYAKIDNPHNYRLVYELPSGEYIEPEIQLTNNSVISGISDYYAVKKGEIYITLGIQYQVQDSDTCWQFEWTPGVTTYITGLGSNSKFVGTLATVDDNPSDNLIDKGVYSYTTGVSKTLQWQQITIDYSPTPDYTVSFMDTGWYVYNEALKITDERQYYDVIVIGDVEILYNQFNPKYYIGEATDFANTKVLQQATLGSYGDRQCWIIEFPIDGKIYQLTGEDLAAKAFSSYNVVYFDEIGTNTNDVAFTFQEIGEYFFAVSFTAKYHDSLVENIYLKAVKSDVVVNDLTKVYDGKKVDPLNDGNIPRIGMDQIIYLDYVWYDALGNELPEAPHEVGSYKVHINLPEGEYFNAYDQVISFDITHRIIEIDVTGSHVYNTYHAIFAPDPMDLKLNNNLLPTHDFVGQLWSSDSVPGKYSFGNSGLHFIWTPQWQIFDNTNADVSSNYKVEVIGEYEIIPLSFVYTATGFDGHFDGLPHSIEVEVTYPNAGNFYPASSANYTIYYSTYVMHKGMDTTGLLVTPPPFSAMGTYRVYFMIVAEYFETVIDYRDIIIREKVIKFIDPARDSDITDSLGNVLPDYPNAIVDGSDTLYRLEYTGTYQTYEVKVNQPWNAVVEYTVDGVNWVNYPYQFIDYGVYSVRYRITAPNYQTILSDAITIEIVSPQLEFTDYEVEYFVGEYDGNPHTVEVTVNVPADSTWNYIYYSVDGLQWTLTRPEYVEVGRYPVKVKIANQNYKDVIVDDYIVITGVELKNLTVIPYVGIYDGNNHNVSITADNVTYNSDEQKYYYLDIPLNVYFTSNPNVVISDNGWTPWCGIDADGNEILNGYKDVGVYPVYIKVTGLNISTFKANTYELVTIQFNNNPTCSAEDQQIEYSKAPLDTSLVVIDTIADGNRTFYYYQAYNRGTYDAPNYQYADPLEPISFDNGALHPQELGTYYVRVEIAKSTNTAAVTQWLFIEIVPKKVQVQWTEEYYYVGADRNYYWPNAVVESGTSDILYVVEEIYRDDTGVIPSNGYDIDVPHLYRVSLEGSGLLNSSGNPNYVIENDIITVYVRRKPILFELNEVKDFDGEKWTEEDVEFYDPTDYDPWKFLALPLINGHYFSASMETNSGGTGTYKYYETLGGLYRYFVTINEWKIVDKDGVEIPNYENYYEFTFNIIVTIKLPDFDLSKIEWENEYDFDGYAHTVRIKDIGVTGGYNLYFYNAVTDEYDMRVGPPHILAVDNLPIQYLIEVDNFEPTYGVVYLTIHEVEIEVTLNDLAKKSDLMTPHDEYSATPHINAYDVSNIANPEHKPNATKFKYYSADEYTEEEIKTLYSDYDNNLSIIDTGIDEIIDAGTYYCVAYFEGVEGKWKTSTTITPVILKPRDIYVTFPSPINISLVYNKQPYAIYLGNASIDYYGMGAGHSGTGLINDGTIRHQIISPLADSSVQTKSANAGIYNPTTDFVFGQIDIRDNSGRRIKSSNYHPILSNNVSVTITKAYLTDDTYYLITDNLDSDGYLNKIYDGHVNSPEKYTDSDGAFSYIFYYWDDSTGVGQWLECDPSDWQTDVGKYLVRVYQLEGTNHFSSIDSAATGYLSESYIEGYVQCNPKEVDVIWENEVKDFTGEKISIDAYIIDAETDVDNPTRLDLQVIYWDDIVEDWIPYKVNAGTYEAIAQFDTSTPEGERFNKNYILNNVDNIFTINQIYLTIQLGDGSDSNQVKYYTDKSPWTEIIRSVTTPNAPEILDFPSNLVLEKGTTNAAIIQTKGRAVGTYSSTSDFNLNFVILNSDGLDVTESFVFDILGSVTIFSDSVYYECQDIELVYEEGTTYSFDQLGCLVVYNPTNYTIQYKVNGAQYWTNEFERIGKAGVYNIQFQIQGEGYSPVADSVTVTILQRDAYLVFENSLDKPYDGFPVNVSPSNIKTYGFNGDFSNLVYNYYEYDNTGGSVVTTPLGNTAPSKVGNYYVEITSTADDPASGVHKNYTDLYITKDFIISSKTVTFNYGDLVEVEPTDIGRTWSVQGEIDPGDTHLVGCPSGVKFIYEIQMTSLERGHYTAYELFKYNISTVGQLVEFLATNGTEFSFSWQMVETDSAGNIIYIENDEGLNEYSDASCNFKVNLIMDLTFRYPLLDITVTGYEGEYDGVKHFGSYRLNQPISPTSTLKTYFSIDVANIANKLYDNCLTRINDSTIGYDKPGYYPVYYLFEANGYEDFSGVYYIDIAYLTRQVTFDPSDVTKEYDGLPVGRQIVTTEGQIYIPNYTLSYADDSHPDVINTQSITILYNKSGSAVLTDPRIGCINAGEYSFILTIPASQYYAESVVMGIISIKPKRIYIEDKPGFPVLHTYDGGFAFYNIDMSVLATGNNYNIYFLQQTSSGDMKLPIYEQGYCLETTLATKSSRQGTYSGLAGNLDLLYHEYRVTQLITGEDLSINFIIDVGQASITIVNDTMSVTSEDVTVTYDNEYHGIQILVTKPSNVNLVRFEYFNDLTGQWQVEPVFKKNVGNYVIKYRLSAENYDTYEGESNLIIEKAKTLITYVTPLDKVYDGLEVTLPEFIKTNNIETDVLLFTYKYYEYFEDGTLNPTPIYTQTGIRNSSGTIDITTTENPGRPVNVGRYLLTIDIPETDNFKACTGYQKEFKISGIVTDINWGHCVFTYNGNPQKPSGVMQLTQEDTNDGVVINLLIKVTPISNADYSHTDAGKYLATAEIDYANSDPVKALNYKISTNSVNQVFIINPRALNIDLNYLLPYQGDSFIYEFDSDLDSEYHFILDSLAPGHELDGVLKMTSGAVGTYVDLHEFVWFVTGAPATEPKVRDANGNLVTHNYSILPTYNVTISSSITSGSIRVEGWEGPYDGLEHGILVEVDPSIDATVWFSYDFKHSWTLTNPMFTAVGSYTVFFKLIDNVSRAEIYNGYEMVIIHKALPNLSLANPTIALGKIYDGEPIQDPEVTYTGMTPGDTSGLTYEYQRNYNGSFYKIPNNPIEAGDYVLKIILDATDDYQSQEIELHFTIQKRLITIQHDPTSKTYDGLLWSYVVQDADVYNLVAGHTLRQPTIQTISANHGTYVNGTLDFMWNSGVKIYNADGDEVQKNYDIEYELNVTINKAQLVVEFLSQAFKYDSQPHSIRVNIKGTYDPETGNTIPRVYANNDQIIINYMDGSSGIYQRDEIFKTNKGIYTINAMITVPNYETVFIPAIMEINDDGNLSVEPPEQPGPGQDPNYKPNDATNSGGLITFTNPYIYNGLPYTDPVYNSTLNGYTGTYDIYYMTLDNYKLVETNYPGGFTLDDFTTFLPSNPINVGSYVFVIDLHGDGTVMAREYYQRFDIQPKPVDVIWENVAFVYDGNDHSPTASYIDVNGNIVYCTLTNVPQSQRGTHQTTASTTDANYSLNNPNRDWTIANNLVDDLVFKDAEFEFGDPIILEDTNGNKYVKKEDIDSGKIDPSELPDNTFVIESNGHISKLEPDGSLSDPNLPYDIIIDYDENAGEHKVTITLKDPENNSWGAAGNTDDQEYIFKINPINIPDPEGKYQLVADYVENWLYNNGLPIEPSPFTLYLQETDTLSKKELTLGTDYTISYANNTAITDSAEIIVTGIGNYAFNQTFYFKIMEELPTILQLKIDAKVQWIEATYSTEESAKFVEDGSITHNTANQSNLYLGHIHQETLIQAIIDQFDNLVEFIKVYDTDGITEILPEQWSLRMFGTGMKIVLVDGSGNEVDSVQGIVFGDYNGDGYINYGDSDLIIYAVLNRLTPDDNGVELICFFASVTERLADNFSSYVTYGDSDRIIGFVLGSNPDFNTFGGKY